MSRSPSPKLRLMSCVTLYRKIAIAEKILNATFAAFVLPTILFSVVGIQIFSGFVSISRDSLIPMPQFLLFPLVWLNCTLFNMLVTTLSSYVYGNSNRIIGTLGELGCKLRFRIGRRLARRELRSCAPLKIKFGNNFISGITPLVNQDLALNQTVSLVLLRKS